MDKGLNEYLEKIDRYLKPMAVSERVDIIKEIKSGMIELQNSNELSEEEIISRLGEPRELAKAYLGEALSKSDSFNWRQLGSVIAFYSLAGFGGLFVLPCTSITAVALMLCGIIVPIGGIIKFIGFLLGIEVPFVTFQMGSYTLHPVLVFPISIVTGCLLFFAGKKLWKATIMYIQNLSKKRKTVQ